MNLIRKELIEEMAKKETVIGFAAKALLENYTCTKGFKFLNDIKNLKKDVNKVYKK